MGQVLERFIKRDEDYESLAYSDNWLTDGRCAVYIKYGKALSGIPAQTQFYNGRDCSVFVEGFSDFSPIVSIGKPIPLPGNHRDEHMVPVKDALGRWCWLNTVFWDLLHEIYPEGEYCLAKHATHEDRNLPVVIVRLHNQIVGLAMPFYFDSRYSNPEYLVWPEDEREVPEDAGR